MAENKPIRIDAEGYNIMTQAMKSLLNQFPGLEDGEVILFENLDPEYGIAFSADNGALIVTEKRTITDKVMQECQYPFYVVYRIASDRERTKISVLSFLDDLGKWLSGEPTEIDGEVYRSEWPELSSGRKIKRINRNNAYGLEPSEDGVQDWVLPVVVDYTNEYYL